MRLSWVDLKDRFFENVWVQGVITFPTGMYLYHMGMTIFNGLTITGVSWPLVGAILLVILGFVVVQMPYFYWKNKNVGSTTVVVRTDTNTPVIIDGEDDIDGDGRGGDSLRRMGIID